MDIILEEYRKFGVLPISSLRNVYFLLEKKKQDWNKDRMMPFFRKKVFYKMIQFSTCDAVPGTNRNYI